jgi:hypothetical protein
MHPVFLLLQPSHLIQILKSYHLKSVSIPIVTALGPYLISHLLYCNRILSGLPTPYLVFILYTTATS